MFKDCFRWESEVATRQTDSEGTFAWKMYLFGINGSARKKYPAQNVFLVAACASKIIARVNKNK